MPGEPGYSGRGNRDTVRRRLACLRFNNREKPWSKINLPVTREPLFQSSAPCSSTENGMDGQRPTGTDIGNQTRQEHSESLPLKEAPAHNTGKRKFINKEAQGTK